jgi:hypothetical protein
LKCVELTPLEFPILRFPMPPGVDSPPGLTLRHLSSTRMLRRWDRRVSGFRDFSRHEFLDTKNPEIPNPELFQILGHASLGSTAMTVSGNRGSRFRYARVHDSRKPDIPNSDSPGSFATCPCCLDGSDPIGKSQIAIPICKSSCPLENPMLQTRLVQISCHVSCQDQRLRSFLGISGLSRSRFSTL